ncbi:unnamed protein product, partial [Didymodactylos carnosus]
MNSTSTYGLSCKNCSADFNNSLVLWRKHIFSDEHTKRIVQLKNKALPRSPLEILLFVARFNRIELFTDIFRIGFKRVSNNIKEQYEGILYIYGRSYRAIGKTKQAIRQKLAQHVLDQNVLKLPKENYYFYKKLPDAYIRRHTLFELDEATIKRFGHIPSVLGKRIQRRSQLVVSKLYDSEINENEHDQVLSQCKLLVNDMLISVSQKEHKRLFQYYQRLAHQTMSDKTNGFYCDLCKAFFLKENSLLTHLEMKCHHRQESKLSLNSLSTRYRCAQLIEIYTGHNPMTENEIKEIDIINDFYRSAPYFRDQSLYHDPLCNKYFIDLYRLQKHINSDEHMEKMKERQVTHSDMPKLEAKFVVYYRLPKCVRLKYSTFDLVPNYVLQKYHIQPSSIIDIMSEQCRTLQRFKTRQQQYVLPYKKLKLEPQTTITTATVIIPTSTVNTVISNEDDERKTNTKQKHKNCMNEVKVGHNKSLTLSSPPLNRNQTKSINIQHQSSSPNNVHLLNGKVNGDSVTFRPQLYSQQQSLLQSQNHYYNNPYSPTPPASTDIMYSHFQQQSHPYRAPYYQQHSLLYPVNNYVTDTSLISPPISPYISSLCQSSNHNSSIQPPLNYYQQSHCLYFQPTYSSPTPSIIVEQEPITNSQQPILPRVDNDEIEFFRLQWKIEDHLIRAKATLDSKKRYRSSSSSSSCNSSSHSSHSACHRSLHQSYRHKLKRKSRSREQSSNRRNYSKELQDEVKSQTQSRTRDSDSVKRRHYSDVKRRESLSRTIAKHSEHHSNTPPAMPSLSELPTPIKLSSSKSRANELIDVLADLIEQKSCTTNNERKTGTGSHLTIQNPSLKFPLCFYPFSDLCYETNNETKQIFKFAAVHFSYKVPATC